MYQLYDYARTRLYGNAFQRDQFLKILVKRTLKSVSRSTGRRINKNKWIRLIDHLVASCPTERGPKLIESIKAELVSYVKTNQQTCSRINLLLDYIAADRDLDGALTKVEVFTKYHPEFITQGQESWMMQCVELNGFMYAQCGHFENSNYISTVRGNEEEISHHQSVCQNCATRMTNSGERVSDYMGNLILASFAVTVHNGNGSTRIADRRNPGLTYNLQHQVWHTDGWSPYANLIGNYHSSKARGFTVIDSPWMKSNRRAFGCELEVQVVRGSANAAAGRVHEALNPSLEVGEYCFFERDGSIGEGFEIVTQPAGLDVHKEKFALFLKDTAMKQGLRSHEGGKCGLHVHVGRDYVTQSQIYRIQSFLNDVRNEALIRAIARRYESGYCKYKPVMAKFTAHNKNNGERYEALNVQNPETIEFRIFRGSLRYESIMAALEFVNAILTFCTPGVTSIMDFHSIGFKKFILQPSQRNDTKFLRSYLSLDADYDNERQAA